VTETANRQALGSGRWDTTFDSHFSQGFVANSFIFVSGQLPVDAAGALVGAGDVAQQARQVFHNIGDVLAQAASSLSEIVQLNLFLLDISDIPRIANVRRELFGEHRPASTAVQVAGLLLPGAKLEINAVALRTGAGGA
jgi:2-iminobutanoate/2-iminopropanoate deaminase